MGIRFSDSLLTLLAASAVVFSAYLIGHALSSDHAGWAWISAPVLILAGGLLGTFTARRIRSYAVQRGEELQT